MAVYILADERIISLEVHRTAIAFHCHSVLFRWISLHMNVIYMYNIREGSDKPPKCQENEAKLQL
jgi:hypothetical protein